MGNIITDTNNKNVTNLNHVHTIEQFTQLVNNPITCKKLHRQMIREKQGCKIFICRKTCEYDETDPELIAEFKSDFVLSQYKHQYYIGEITFDQTSEWPAIANLIWNDIESVMSYSFNVYCLHRKYSEFKSLVVIKYYTPPRSNRTKQSGYSMSDDLIAIAKYLPKLTAKSIEDRILTDLNIPHKLRALENANKHQNGIYDRMYQLELANGEHNGDQEESKFEPALV